MTDRILSASTFLPAKNKNSSCLLVARAGMGKTHQVLHLALDSLTEKDPVILLDCGRTYRGFCAAIGGTYVMLRDDGKYDAQHFGAAPLVVFEFEELTHPWDKALPAVLDWTAAQSRGLLAVDEVFIIGKLYPALVGDLQARVAQGAHFCVVGRAEDEVAAYRHIDTNVRLVTMTEFSA